jgi:hypothetical protein
MGSGRLPGPIPIPVPFFILSVLLLLGIGLARPATAQYGIGVKAGTAGMGADLGLGISGPLSLRVGVGVTDLPGVTITGQFEVEDLTYTLTLPRRFVMVGLDLHLLGPLVISGGMIWRDGDLAFTADVVGATQIGGVTYTEPGTLTGVLEMEALAPFVGLSLGRLAHRGAGAFVMVGAAVSGEPLVGLSATGPITGVPGFDQSLEVARAEAQDRIPDWLTVWPIVQIGFRVGL